MLKGSGAVVVVSPEVAKSLSRGSAKILGHGEATKNPDNGRIDLTYTGAVWSGPRAFVEARRWGRQAGSGTILALPRR